MYDAPTGAPANGGTRVLRNFFGIFSVTANHTSSVLIKELDHAEIHAGVLLRCCHSHELRCREWRTNRLASYTWLYCRDYLLRYTRRRCGPQPSRSVPLV